MPSDYLQGNASISTEAKVQALKEIDNSVSSLSTSVISQNEGTGQNLPNPISQVTVSGTPIPAFSTLDLSTIPKTNSQFTDSSLVVSSSNQNRSSTNLGLSGELTLRARDFEVQYRDVNGSPKTYSFSLLPAIENNLRSNHSGATVPEVKPGILVRTSMNIKRFSVPGAAPVFQSLGIEQTILQLVGLFIGAEGDQFSSPDNIIYGRYQDVARYNSAYRQSLVFDQDVVQSGREVNITIRSEGSSSADVLSMNYKALLQNFRCFIARSDRVYYSMEAVILNYRQNRLPISLVTSQPGSNVNTNTLPASIQSIVNAARPLRSPNSNPFEP